MIIVGNQRGGARDLARHLLKDENEQVVVHQLRGFASESLSPALQESQAIARGTRCKQHLFSASFNPPMEVALDAAAFEKAIDQTEARLGLEGQPRAIVFHEKRGADGDVRRHAHAVWCRIDAAEMKAKQLSFSRQKMQEVSRELYREHGWVMPRGFVRHQEANPRNYTLAEWQQAKRAKKDPEKQKALFQDTWAISDSRASFAHALEERGYILCRGDRRGFVAVDHSGEAYAVSRWVGLKSKQVKDKLGDPASLPSIDQGQAKAAKIITDRLEQLKGEEQQRERVQLKKLDEEQARHKQAQKAEQQKLLQRQRERQAKEAAERLARFRKGVLGFVDWISGRKAKIEKANAIAAARSRERDQREHQAIEAKKERAGTRFDQKLKAIKTAARRSERMIESEISELKNVKQRQNYVERQKAISKERTTSARRPRRGSTPRREL